MGHVQQDKPLDQGVPEPERSWPWTVHQLGTTALWLAFAGWVAWLVLR